MRITNTMMINTSLLNLNRGLEKLQTYDTQVQTGKKISVASENPIIAGKTIKYNTRLYEIDQYLSNTSAATSWLKSSETALNTTESIVKRMRELIQQCSSETLSDSDRLSNQVELKELRGQLIQEANSSVAGRYLFSGYKTNEKVMFDTESEKEYYIYETLDYKNSTQTLADDTGILYSRSVKTLYSEVSNLKVKVGEDVFTEDGTDGCTLIYKSQGDLDAYNPPKVDDTTTPPTKVIHIIRETGEIVFEENYYSTINTDIETEYDKSGFDVGELNPIHYVDCAEKVTISPTRLGTADSNIVLDNVGGVKEGSIRNLSINGSIVIDENGDVAAPYTLNYTKSTDKTNLGANEIRVNMDTGELQFGSNIAPNSPIDVQSFYKSVESPHKVEITTKVELDDTNVGGLNASNTIKLRTSGSIDKNSIYNLNIGGIDVIVNGNEASASYPVKYTTSTDTTPIANNEVRINMDTGEIVCGSDFNTGDEVIVDKYYTTKTTNAEEDIEYEINSNTKLAVNSLAGNIFTTDLIKDLDLILNRIENFDRDEVTKLCGHALTQIDGHIDQILKETAIVGSKMNKITLVESRLTDDKVNYKELKSDNEDIDETEALTNLALQELVYTAAMNATSKILQQSLLDFLN